MVVRLADAVPAKQHHNLSLFHLQGDVVENVAIAVVGIDAAQAEHTLLSPR